MKATNYEIFKLMAADLAKKDLFQTNRTMYDLCVLVAIQFLLNSGLTPDEEQKKLSYVFWKLKPAEIDQFLEVSRLIKSLKPKPKDPVEDYEPKTGDLVEFSTPGTEHKWANGLIYFIGNYGIIELVETLSGRTFRADKSQVRKRKNKRNDTFRKTKQGISRDARHH
jgi:hypothetical protein